MVTQDRKRMIHVLITIALLACVTASVSAQGTTQPPNTVIPLEGLDPVMLSQGKEVQGDMKHQVTRGQFQYIFANAENKATFEKDPARYEIQLNGYCARMGAPTTANPDLYAVHKERIYIFGSEECQTLFKTAPEKYLEVPAEPKAPPTAEMFKRGQQLIAKAVEALGGTKLDQLVSFQRKELRGNNIKITLLLAFPGEVRQETTNPNFTFLSIATPAEAFFVFNNTARTMSEANRTAFDKELHREPIVLLRARSRSDFKAWAVGKGDQQAEHVEIELAGFNTTLGIDPATGRVLSQTYRGRGPGGVIGEIVINYSDFRTVEGLQVPSKVTTTFDGQPYPALSATIEATTVNGDVVYGSSGDFGPAPFTAVDVKTGKVLWRHRSFPRASFLLADNRFIILDEDGHLLLATATAEGLTVTAKAELLGEHAWTAPSLAGTRLYVRDRKNIMALELGTR